MKIKFKSEYLMFLIPLGLILVATRRVWQANPTVMGDEYIYSTQARHLPFAEHPFINYLFSGTMKLTTYCGVDFYYCTKAINAVIFTIGIFISFLIARTFLSFNWSIFAAAVTAASPLALQISYFMPETMYFTSMTIVIWLSIKATKSGTWWSWLLVGLMLGLTALVKPHAIFILLPIVVYSMLLFIQSKQLAKAAVAAVSIVIGFLASKLSLGYAFAGSVGLNLFGGYNAPGTVLSEVLDTAESVSDPTDAAVSSSRFDVFLDVFPSHFIYHFGVMFLLAGVPLFFGAKFFGQSLFKRVGLQRTTSYFVLIFLIAITLLFIIPAFEAYVTVAGDDHSQRLILRYYEFLIPQFIVMGLLLPTLTPPRLVTRILQAAVIIGAGIWLAESYSRNFGWKFADSSTLPGIAKTSSFLLVAIFIGFAVAYWAEKPKRGGQVLGIGAIPIILVLSLFLAQNTLIDRRGDVSVIELAGWETRAFLEGVSGADIMVIGEVRPNVFATKFWIDKPGIKDLLVVEGGTLAKENLDGAQYIVFLGQFQMSDPHTELIAGEGFKLLKVE